MATGPTIGSTLERERLEHRARRIVLVLNALHERVDARATSDGVVPVPLRQAIAGFQVELAAARRRLQALPEPEQQRSGGRLAAMVSAGPPEG